MALISCKECGERISSSAKVCPRCGKKQKGTRWKVMLYVVGAFYGIAFVNYLINGTPKTEKQEPKPILTVGECKEFAYLHSYTKWSSEMGESVDELIASKFKIRVWDKRTSEGKGKIRGELSPGARVQISTEGIDDYMVEGPRIKMSFGWINKNQIEKTKYENTITRERCTPL